LPQGICIVYLCLDIGEFQLLRIADFGDQPMLDHYRLVREDPFTIGIRLTLVKATVWAETDASAQKQKLK